MDASHETAYKKLHSTLEDMILFYRQLLEVVRKEKDLLIKADIDLLSENNSAKEAVLSKIKAIDSIRERYAKELCQVLGAETESPRLLEIARLIKTEWGDQLRNMHATLTLLTQRVTSLNQENADYAASALNSLNGAMGEIKDTLAGKTTYERKGKMNYGPDKAGNFVSKEA